MENRRPLIKPARLYGYFAILAIVLLYAAHFFKPVLHFGSPLNGWWIKEAGLSQFPEQMTIRCERDTLKIRYPDSGGVTTVSRFVDGQPHTIPRANPVVGNLGQSIYTAELKADSAIVALQIDNPANVQRVSLPEEGPYSLRWEAKRDGSLSIVRSPGEQMVVLFRRAPIGRLFSQSPP